MSNCARLLVGAADATRGGGGAFHTQELVPVRVAMVFHPVRLLETCARTTMSLGGGSGSLSRRARRPSSPGSAEATARGSRLVPSASSGFEPSEYSVMLFTPSPSGSAASAPMPWLAGFRKFCERHCSMGVPGVKMATERWPVLIHTRPGRHGSHATAMVFGKR